MPSATSQTTSYLFIHAGKAVIVVDDGAIGSGETGRTTVHHTAAFDDRDFDLERLRGDLHE